MPVDLAELTAEADQLYAEDDVRCNQPPGIYVTEAEGLLGEDAPWHRIAYVAHALRQDELDEG